MIRLSRPARRSANTQGANAAHTGREETRTSAAPSSCRSRPPGGERPETDCLRAERQERQVGRDRDDCRAREVVAKADRLVQGRSRRGCAPRPRMPGRARTRRSAVRIAAGRSRAARAPSGRGSSSRRDRVRAEPGGERRGDRRGQAEDRGRGGRPRGRSPAVRLPSQRSGGQRPRNGRTQGVRVRGVEATASAHRSAPAPRWSPGSARAAARPRSRPGRRRCSRPPSRAQR